MNYKKIGAEWKVVNDHSSKYIPTVSSPWQHERTQKSITGRLIRVG